MQKNDPKTWQNILDNKSHEKIIAKTYKVHHLKQISRLDKIIQLCCVISCKTHLAHSITYSLIHSLIHSFTHLFIHSLIYSTDVKA